MILLSQVDLASGLGFEEACYAQVSNPCIFCLTSSTSLNWNPHSLLPITPNPTPWPSTQLTLVYTHYVYPPREEERDSKMDGFKLDIFYREAGINRSTGELAAPRLAEHKKLSGLIHLI